MIKFDTKANTLEHLRPQLCSAKILPLISFSVQDWKKLQSNELASVTAFLKAAFNKNHTVKTNINDLNWLNQKLIVRSSSKNEDLAHASNAGHYTSVANVSFPQIKSAIQQVIDSYGECTDQDQVLIQPMIDDAAISGVAFTRDPSNAGHYYVINYDDHSGKTNSVTSGGNNSLKTLFISKQNILNFNGNLTQNTWVYNLINLLLELQTLFKDDALDVEFAISKENQLLLFQVRKLNLHNDAKKDVPEFRALNIEEHTQCLHHIAQRIKELQKPHPYLLGKRTVFGLMPDWNPAEIIGVRPRPLALSLYKTLITDNVWAYQRDNYGYRNLRSFPLLVNFHGIPYIDVRVSFNSFIPKDLDDDLANKLVDHYVQQLTANPTYHDKVEFEIIQSCYTLDIEDRLNQLKAYGFDDNECYAFQKSLRNITNLIVNPKTGLWKKDISKLETLTLRREKILNSKLTPLEKIYWLIEDCKRYGTLPFAGLARAGFIATQMLNSFLKQDLFSEEDYQSFFGSLSTVSSELVNDYAALNRTEFIHKYGHLRPGTYDILSPRYDETPEDYFKWKNNYKAEQTDTHKKCEFKLSLEKLNAISALLKQHDLDLDILSLFDFLKGAIEGREYAKFLFTKSLSECLKMIGNLAKEQGISIDDAAYMNIDIIESIYASSKPIETSLKASIQAGKEAYRFTRGLVLPSLIIDVNDIYAHHLDAKAPNFITLSDVTAETISNNLKDQNISGKIVMIPSADPGFDWIFSHKIAGFITMYGGVNSHMAIRAAELSIPAITGCGEHYYQQWSRAKVLQLNCADKQVRIIS